MAWEFVKVVERREWAPDLITLRLGLRLSKFTPGQFVNLGLDLDGERVRRSYSLANASGSAVEVLLSRVAGGALTPSLFERSVGDGVWVDDRALGFFTLEQLPPASDLWLLATGTGLGPYLSILRTGQLWERFDHVVVLHGVSRVRHLAHADELMRMARAANLTYVPAVTREPPPRHGLSGRITALMQSGDLESHVGLQLSPTRTHVMLCGNPAMITDARALLHDRGLERHTKRKPGHVSFESYW